MTIKNVLVHIDNADPCDARIEAAVAVARAHQAHLIGLYLKAYAYICENLMVEMGPAIYEKSAEEYEVRASQAEERFRKVVDGSDISHEWRCVECSEVGYVRSFVSYARCCDIAVVGQRHRHGIDFGERETPDWLILSSGRPVLLIPHEGRFSSIGQHILVAWNASEQASRAVHDALPFLKAAKSVTVVSVGSPKRAEGDAILPRDALCGYLSRHGLTPVFEEFGDGGVDAGETLLSMAKERKADLVVMGAYGHTRLRELVLGGATRDMINHATMPLLLSH